MKKRIKQWFASHRLITIECIAVFLISMLVTTLVARRKTTIVFTTDGFDFSASRNDSSSGPPIGETVNLNLLKGQDGRSLLDITGDTRLRMIAVVDPQCPACRVAQDQMRGISKRLEAAGIPYFLVMLRGSESPEQRFAYADSLGFSSKAFIWKTKEKQPPSSLAEMVIPSHLLINRNGVIVDKWPGSHPDPAMRQRMVNQITADALKHLSH